MNFKNLNKYLIILVVFGLFLLFLHTIFYTPKEISLLEDNTKYLNKVVAIEGVLKNLNLKNNHLFFEICEFSRCLTLVYFNISSKNLELLNEANLKNKTVKVIGNLELYNQKQQIIVYKFEVK